MQCVMKSSSPKKLKRKKEKERIMSQMVARKSSGLMSAPLMLTCFLLLPNHAAVSTAHCIPVKEGVRFPEGLALPL